MTEVEVTAGLGGYKVVIEAGLRATLAERLQGQFGDCLCLVVTDANTAAIGAPLAEALDAGLHSIPAGESSKSFEQLQTLCVAAAAQGLDRDGVIVAVGGGVVGDLAGVAAAIYLRGVRIVHVPTTLLAMVDSAIGGKAAIDMPAGKNLVGAFKSPEAVFVDPELLRALPQRELLSGLAEVAKYSMISDERLFDLLISKSQQVLQKDVDLLTSIIARCCQIKAEVVSTDEHDQGMRAILNYGHTIGHALEAVTGYSRFTHGEAISIGMTVAARAGVLAGVTPEEVAARQAELLDSYGLPQSCPPGITSVEALLEAASRDKKSRGGRIAWVLLDALGRAIPGQALSDEIAHQAVSGALEDAA